MSDISDIFLNKLYDMSEGEKRSINRNEDGEQLDLPNAETDSIVNRLYARRTITKDTGSNILLTQEAKNMLDKGRHST